MSEKSEQFKVIQDPKQFEPVEIASVYESVNFTLRDEFITRKDFHDAAYCAGVYGFFVKANDQLVGVARVMSDDNICSWIAEVCVRPDWQGKGVGATLMENVINRFKHTAIYLEAFQDSKEFFEKFGVTAKPKLVACSKAPVRE